MSKKILYQENARYALERGIDILAGAVSVTLGPKGRNVVLEKKLGAPQIVNDGITIAKEIQLEDAVENTGVSLIRQATSKTNDIAGDGTTTATILAHAIVKQGMKNVAAGANPIEIKKGIEKATKFIINQIEEYARPILQADDITQVARISAGNDLEIGKMISNAIKQVGQAGIISLEESRSTNTELEITKGMKIDKGFISPYFVNDLSKMQVVQENPYILITDRKITLVQQELIPVLEKIKKLGKPILIIADDIEKEALATILINKLRGTINIVAIRAPGFGDRRKALLEDIGILTNGSVISEDFGLSFESIGLEMFGRARKVTVNRDSTIIIADDQQNKVQQRCIQIRRQLEISSNEYEKEKLQERLAKLSGGVAVIKVGAATETEMQDRKLRLEDAINATRAAIEEGIVPGGGSTLTHISQDLLIWAKETLTNEQQIGASIVEKSLYIPLSKIVENAGGHGAIVINQVIKNSYMTGYNVNQSKLVNMFDEGIIDPAKVTRCALQNATSIASMVLTTDCIIIEATKQTVYP